MSRLRLKHWQRTRLRRQLKVASDARLYRRTLAVLELDRGRPAADIAAMLGVTRQSVHNWAAAYTRDFDPAALADDRRSGRPPLLTDEVEWSLRSLLGRSPQDFGYPDTSWTAPLLRAELGRELGWTASQGTLRRALRRLGYLWKRPRYVLAPDPEREKKTPHPTPDRGVAAPERRAGRGRDRPDGVPAPAGRVVATRRAGRGPAPRRQRQAGDLRSDEPPDGDAAVAAAVEGAQR